MGNSSSSRRAREELERLSDATSRRERELQEAINKLQESERERSLLVETLRLKLEDTRQKLVASDNKVHQLETQLHEEKLTTANGIKKIEELEQEKRRLREELESEKAAREEAWAKISVLELEIDAAMRDLDFERRRLRVANERLMLAETQLRAFYSTTEVMQMLFAKQQEQLKAMQRTVEDEEKHGKTSEDMDGVIGETSGREKEAAGYHSDDAVTAPSTSTTAAQKLDGDQIETPSNEASVTEKHDRDMRTEECQDTQEAGFTSADHDHDVGGGLGSDVDGVGAAAAAVTEGDGVTKPVLEANHDHDVSGGFGFDIDGASAAAAAAAAVTEGDAGGTEQVLEADRDHDVSGGFVPYIDGAGAAAAMMEGDAGGTELVLETESPRHYGEQNIDLNECGPLDVDTRRFDDGINAQETEEYAQTPSHEALHHPQLQTPVDTEKPAEDTGAGGTTRTADLLTESESPRSTANDEGCGGGALKDSDILLVAGSQSTPSDAMAARPNEQQALLFLI